MKRKKENKNILFSKEDIDVVCPQKMVWDEMEIVGEGRRLCEGCDKVLVDVTGYTKEEVIKLQKKDPTICVAIANTLIVSSLSFSLLSAGGNIEEVQSLSESNDTRIEVEESMPEKEVIVEVGMPVQPPPIVVTLGVPARPTCSEGTANLNAIKRFFGFREDTSCIGRSNDE